MGTIEIEEGSFHTLGLRQGVSLREVIDAYIRKTSQEKFRVIILSNEALEEDFKKYHRAYLTILRSQFESETSNGLGYYPHDKAFKLLFNQGIYHLINHNFLKAVDKLEQAYKLNNKDGLVIIYLGILMMKKKSFDAAEKYFNDAIKIDRNNGDAWFFMGENYLKSEELDKALDAYNTAKFLSARVEEISDRIKGVKEKIKQSPQQKTSFIKRLFGSKKK